MKITHSPQITRVRYSIGAIADQVVKVAVQSALCHQTWLEQKC
jgi:hypothetical protein